MASKKNKENMDNACVVCFRTVDIYSIGSCDHPVCYECSTRMRVLCKQNECPICRQDLPKVVFTSKIRPYSSITLASVPFDAGYGIHFDALDSKSAFRRLLVHPCAVCPDKPNFQNFAQMKDHMRKEHELFFCELCTDNLKVFDYERRYYTRTQLALHRRKGDPDNTSYRGHPLCQFCDQRYLDNDELFRHLRKEHFFCHFCDADGLHQFYANYNELREHFRATHYLCEEGNCQEEKFTSVFRTDIDFKAHRVQYHSHHLGKAAAKQARTLELEFTLASRPKEDSRRGGMKQRGRRAPNSMESRSQDQYSSPPSSRQDDPANFTNGHQQPIDAALNDLHAFPLLGKNDRSQVQQPSDRERSNDSLAQKIGKTSNLTVRSSYVQGFGATEAAPDEEFPSLVPGNTAKFRNEPKANGHAFVVRLNGQSKMSGSDNAAGGSNVSVGLQVNQGNVQRPASKQGTVGAQVTRVASSQNIRMQPTNRLSGAEDFPSLSSGKDGRSDGRSQVLWGPPPTKYKAPEPKKEVKPRREDDFPALPFNERPVTPSGGMWTTKKGKGVASIEIPMGEGGKIQADSSKKGKGGKKKSKTNGGGTSSPKPTMDVAPPAPVPDPAPEKSVKSINMSDSGVSRPESGKKETKRKSLVCNISTDFPPLNQTAAEVSLFDGKTQPPPPGFGAKPAPPKLFIPERALPSQNIDSGLISPTELTFTSSNGQSYPVLTGFQYLQPPDFAHRNKNLITTLGDLFGANTDTYHNFRQVSAQYRSGSIGSGEYYEQCSKLLGETCFDAVFPELIVLLPDIEKQQGLLAVYRRKMGKGEAGEPFIVCATCGQVLSPCDLRHHLASHTLEKNFPSLSLSSGATSWGKKK